MNINILQLFDGAKDARGIAVIIDVFRAFSVEAYLFAHGADKIFPVADIELAYRYKKENPAVLLIGERGGKICESFDYGNSPSQLQGADLRNKTVVHTTSAGTQGLFGAKNADIVLGASLVNAAATAKYIAKSGIDTVSLVCMGLGGEIPTDEDTLCAVYIKSLLENKPITIDNEIEKLKYTSGAKFFDKGQNDIFPEQDFYLCTDVDRFPFALRLETDENGMKYMKQEK